MKLRIVGGKLGRRVITVPPAAEKFRPTLEKSRISVAEIVKERLPGAVVADLCSGSGAMGFEFLSRGARIVHFIESDRLRALCITDHCKLFGVNISCSVFCEDVVRFVDHFPCKYDLMYFDPPYEDPSLGRTVSALADGLAKGGLLLHERRKKTAPPVLVPGCSIVLSRTRTYGDSAVDFYEKT